MKKSKNIEKTSKEYPEINPNFGGFYGIIVKIVKTSTVQCVQRFNVEKYLSTG